MKISLHNSRTARLLSLLGAVALFASACGVTRGDASPAASLDFSDGSSSEIPMDEFRAVTDSIINSERFVQEAFQGTVPEGFEIQVLNGLIVEWSIDQLLVSNGVTVDQAAIDAKFDEIGPSLSQMFPVQEDADAVALELDAYLVSLARLQAKQAALGAELLKGSEPRTIPCASHILVSEEALALDLIQQLDDGADFAELAATYSEDPGSGAQGGSLGCANADRYVPEFRDAILNGNEGELLGPVKTDFGFHLIVVSGYENQDANPDTLVEAALSELLTTTSVDVEASIGVWEPELTAVVANTADASDQ